MIPLINDLQEEKAYLNQLREASLPSLSEKPEIGLNIDFEEYIECKRHLRFDCTPFQELKQYLQSATENEKEEWLRFDMFSPLNRCSNLLRDRHFWEASHDGLTLVVQNDELKKTQLESDQLFEALSQFGDYTISGLLKQTIISPVIRRRIKTALKNHSLEDFEAVLLGAGDSLEDFYDLANTICLCTPPPLTKDNIKKEDIMGLSLDDITRKFASLHSSILKPKDERTKKAFTGFGEIITDLMSENSSIWDAIVYMLTFMKFEIGRISPEEQQILSVFYESPLYPTLSDDCETLATRLIEILGEIPQVPEEKPDEDTTKKESWTPSKYVWPDISFFQTNAKYVRVSNCLELIPEINCFATTQAEYEKFQKFMVAVADIGKIDTITDMEALIQYFTGRKIESAASIIKWDGTGTNARYLVYIVKKITPDRSKKKYTVLKDRSLVCFKGISEDEQDKIQEKENRPANRITELNPAAVCQDFKNMDPRVLVPLAYCYQCFPELEKYKIESNE